MRSFALCISLLGLCIGLLSGCGSNDPLNRQAVSGLVTYKGKPVPYGSVNFVGQEQQQTTLRLEIRDGKFAVDRSGGLSPGKYKVQVEGFEGPPPPPPDVPTVALKMPKQLIQLSESEKDIEIKSGAKNELKLDY